MIQEDKLLDSHVRKINRSLVYGWLLIVTILFISYTLEVVKDERTIAYLLVFSFVTVAPAILVLILYLRKPDSYPLRYEIVVGYFIMYVFVMITGSTPLVFCYILPMLSLLILYHQPGIILFTGIASMVVNIISIVLRICNGEVTSHNSKEVEIQLALLFLCFLGSYLATRLYDQIHKKNEEYTTMLTERNDEIQRMTMQTIMTIANTIDAKDEYTRGHSRRVAEYSAAIAEELGFTHEEVQDIRFIGLLHDIGKIGIPDAVLNKPGRLTDEEYQVMKGHTTVGAEILKDIDMIKGLDVGARYHHERYDGKGYPDGLAGEKIPMIARIIAVADAYDAMSSNRVYRRHLSKEKVLEELKKGVGTQWDAGCAEAMIRLLEEDRLPNINPDADNEVVQQTSTILTRVIDYAEDKAVDGKENLDALTGAYGRDSGIEAIQNAIGKHGGGCIFLFDIDRFHRINDSEGFVVGDLYLKAMVQMIRSLSEQLILARFGSDEFAAYIPEVEDEEAAAELSKVFFAHMQETIDHDPTISKMSVSIGITEVATEKDKVMVLYENASKALYVSKQKGGNTYYCHRMDEIEDTYSAATHAVDMEQLIEAIQNKEFYKGGLTAAYPEFGRMYEFISSLADRNHQQVQIILFTMVSNTGIKVSIEERDRVMALLQKAIVDSIRNIDITTRYSSTQHAVLLMNLNEEDTKAVINRIMTEFLRTYDKREITIHYDTADLSKSHDIH